MTSLLAVYLRDHHAAGVAGARLAGRLAAARARGSGGDDLRRIASEIRNDLVALEAIMRRLGVEPNRAKDAFARVAERLGALKLNGRLLRRSPLSDLVELETLVVGITGKQALWVSLRQLPSLESEGLDALLERAEEQKRIVENERVAAARRSFASEESAQRRD